jgi:hypothetical protein
MYVRLSSIENSKQSFTHIYSEKDTHNILGPDFHVTKFVTRSGILSNFSDTSRAEFVEATRTDEEGQSIEKGTITVKRRIIIIKSKKLVTIIIASVLRFLSPLTSCGKSTSYAETVEKGKEQKQTMLLVLVLIIQVL